MTARGGRRRANEALLRGLVAETDDSAVCFAGVMWEPFAFACECAAPDCATRAAATIHVYGEVQAHPSRFLVAPGHAGAEPVVERGEGYEVVEGSGVA